MNELIIVIIGCCKCPRDNCKSRLILPYLKYYEIETLQKKSNIF